MKPTEEQQDQRIPCPVRKLSDTDNVTVIYKSLTSFPNFINKFDSYQIQTKPNGSTLRISELSPTHILPSFFHSIKKDQVPLTNFLQKKRKKELKDFVRLFVCL